MTTQQFIELSNIKHSLRYDYSLTSIVNHHDKINIICKKHGTFKQSPKHHLTGSGCQKCGRDFVAKKFTKKWTDSDLKTLKEIYPKYGAKKVSRILGFAEKTIATKVKELGLISTLRSPVANLKKDIPNFLWTSMKNGAKSRNLSFNITRKHVFNLLKKQNYKCALSDWPIELSNDGSKNTASLDRIDSTKGYEKNNIQWVHKIINRTKMDDDEDLLYDICKSIYFHRKSDFEKYELIWQEDYLNDTEFPVRVLTKNK